MTTIGADPGLAHCGFAVLCENEVVLTVSSKYGPKYGTTPQRIALYADDLQHLLEEHEPDVVGVEDQYIAVPEAIGGPGGRVFTIPGLPPELAAQLDQGASEAKARAKSGAAQSVAQVAGALMLVAEQWGCEVLLIHPSTRRAAVNADNWTPEEKIVQLIQRLTGLDGLTPHEADAVAIALAAQRRATNPTEEAIR
jgi:Holliday junction resolvasome RuvABC endonuclease subunit